MNNSSIIPPISPMKLADFIPSLSLRFTLHILDVTCSMTTLITLSRWRKMRSFSMSLICNMMATEFTAALIIGSLEGWHIIDYLTGTSERGLSDNQCYWITGYEGPALVMSTASSLMVSLDRMFSIVAPTAHEQIPFLLKVAAFPTPPLCFALSLSLFASSTTRRTSLEICTTTYIDFGSRIGLLVSHLMINGSIYGTAANYAAVLILTFMKYKAHIHGGSANTGSLEEIKARRYRKMNKVLGFSTICYLLTTSVANTIYLHYEDRQGVMMVVAHFFHGLYAVDGIVTFTSFCFFIPSFKNQLLGKPDTN